MLPINEVTQGDCLDLLPLIPDASVDMILCDLPYGYLECPWDSILPLDELWVQYRRIIKGRSSIVLTSSQPFTSKLVMSNPEMFKYEWIWKKSTFCNFATIRHQPAKIHESILVFSKAAIPPNSKLKMLYNPQGISKSSKKISFTLKNDNAYKPGRTPYQKAQAGEFENYPQSIIGFTSDKGSHPTQKPVKLFEYLIRTYTDEGDMVLDNCLGSGTSAVAALNTGRNFIGIELSEEYCEIARKRIARETRQRRLL